MSFWRKQVIQPALASDVEVAEGEQRAILDRDPQNAGAYSALGTLANFRGDRDAAVKLYQKALDLDASRAEAHVGLGRICVVRGLYTEAWKHAREAERLGDRSLVAQLERYPNAADKG